MAIGRHAGSAGPATSLAFGTQPAAALSGATLGSVTVEARKSSGDVDTTYTGSITVALTTAGGATLSGTKTVAAVAGVATFSGLTVDLNGAYTLTATATGLTSGVSSSFQIDGGNLTATSLYTAYQSMLAWATRAPTAGGTLTINGVSLGSYDFCVADATTVSAFSNTDWFTTTADSRVAFVIVKGNLTINGGQTFKPSNRKLATVLGVNGTLTVSGDLSMSARGAYHGAGGGNVAAGAIAIIAGTHSSVVDPNVPAAGGGGAAGQTATGQTAGTAGTAGGTGGGGNGGSANTASDSGDGSAGTSFSGGSGGGGNINLTMSLNSTASGGPGGGGRVGGASNGGAGGGAGNSGGAEAHTAPGAAANGGDGTGGVLVVFCTTLAGAGTVTAAGVAGGAATPAANSKGAGGGGSGGGSVTILYDTDSSSITPTATGGAGGAILAFTGAAGGAGGDGTARKLQRAA